MMGQSRANSRKLDLDAVVESLGLWSSGSGALYVDLADALAGLIERGEVRAGDRLPPERRLADALAVSRGTVVKAYDRLSDTGRVERVQGSGTIVVGHDVPPTAGDDEFLGGPLWAPGGASISLLQAQPTMLPATMKAIDRTDLGAFGAERESVEPLGWWSLRERIADLHTRHGLATEPHQIAVTSGAQQGVSLLVGAFVRAGDVVLGEEFTWPGLIDSVRHVGARFEPIRMDVDGVDVDDLERAIVRFRPALVLINPQHHNPTGTRLHVERVRRVAELAREHRVMVVEDRVAADLGFDRRQLPAIADFDTAGLGVTVSSVCKVAWPGLRLGWVRADAQIVNRLRTHKAVVDMFTSALSQAAVVHVLDDYDEIVRERVDQLRLRCELAVDALREHIPDWSFHAPRGGMWLWAALPAGMSADAFVQHAARHGVQIASCRQFSGVEADTGHVRVPFTAPEPVLAEGLRRLADAWRTFDGVGATAAVARV